ncbi:MAG: hypothetical protein COA69_02820 [Robiginitomaculum sp.]|nr:MAG: hypothetical protein COA69_02820 [Robiginitomaculum sp.]
MATAGFTLLETLISLAILSVVSLALFQSTASLLRITDRAVFAGERTLEGAIARKTFRVSVGGLTSAWEEREQDVFYGNAVMFSGLSTDVPTLSAQRLQRVSYTLVRQDMGTFVMDVEVDAQAWSLKAFSADHAEFSYLGSDQKWYTSWPPEDVPSPGFFDDAIYMDMPQLPLAIRFHGEDQGRPFDWIATISGTHAVPYRDDF